MKIVSIRLLGLMLIPFVVNALSIDEQNIHYQYYEIQECYIPVPKEYHLVEKSSEYTYNFINSSNPLLTGLKVYTSQEANESHVKRILSAIPYEILTETWEHGFHIIEAQAKGALINDRIYYLLGENSTILMGSLDQLEMKYLLEYCEKTKKD